MVLFKNAYPWMLLLALGIAFILFGVAGRQVLADYPAAEEALWAIQALGYFCVVIAVFGGTLLISALALVMGVFFLNRNKVSRKRRTQ